MAADKISISLTPELHSALTLASLERGTTVSRQIELYLRENEEVQRFVKVVRAEPEGGVQLVHPKGIQDRRAQTHSRRVAAATA